jgi:hypothetical protein
MMIATCLVVVMNLLDAIARIMLNALRAFIAPVLHFFDWIQWTLYCCGRFGPYENNHRHTRFWRRHGSVTSMHSSAASCDFVMVESSNRATSTGITRAITTPPAHLMRVQESRTKSLRDATSYSGNPFPKYFGQETPKSVTYSNNAAQVSRRGTPTPTAAGIGVSSRQAIDIQQLRRSPRLNCDFSPKTASEMTVMDVMTTPKALSFFLGRSGHSKSSTPVHHAQIQTASLPPPVACDSTAMRRFDRSSSVTPRAMRPRLMSLQENHLSHSTLVPILRKAPSTPTASLQNRGGTELAATLNARPRRQSLQDIRVRINIGRTQSTPTASSALVHRQEAKLETHVEINEDCDSSMQPNNAACMQASHAGLVRTVTEDSKVNGELCHNIADAASDSTRDLSHSVFSDNLGNKSAANTQAKMPVDLSESNAQVALTPTGPTHAHQAQSIGTRTDSESDSNSRLSAQDIQSEAQSDSESVDDYAVTMTHSVKFEESKNSNQVQYHTITRHDSVRSGGNRARPLSDEVLTRAIAQAFRNEHPRHTGTVTSSHNASVMRRTNLSSAATNEQTFPAAIASLFKSQRGRSEDRRNSSRAAIQLQPWSQSHTQTQAAAAGSHLLFGRSMSQSRSRSQSPEKSRLQATVPGLPGPVTMRAKAHTMPVSKAGISSLGKPLSRDASLQDFRAEGSLVYSHATVPRAELQPMMLAGKRRASLEDIPVHLMGQVIDVEPRSAQCPA